MGVFLEKTDFWPKKNFSAELKNSLFSVIPARTSVISLMAQLVPPSFVDDGPKLRILIIAKWEWPKMAKNLVEPQKMTPS